MAPEGAIEAAVWRWIDRMELATTRFESCSVVVARGPDAFEVDVEASVDGVHAVAMHDPALTGAHADSYIAVSDAFHSLWRQLRRRYVARAQPRRAVAWAA
jgi:ribosome-associated translation inhibitor RaiA